MEALQKQLEELKAAGEEDEAAKGKAEEVGAELDAKERALLKLQVEEDDKVRRTRKSKAAEEGKGGQAGRRRREEVDASPGVRSHYHNMARKGARRGGCCVAHLVGSDSGEAGV